MIDIILEKSENDNVICFFVFFFNGRTNTSCYWQGGASNIETFEGGVGTKNYIKRESVEEGKRVSKKKRKR